MACCGGSRPPAFKPGCHDDFRASLQLRPMTPDEYLSYDAVGLAELVAAGDLSPSELLQIAVSCVEKCDGHLNAVVDLFFDEATAAIDADLPEGPFKGVPFLLKDLVAEYAGRPTTAGSSLRSNYAASADSELVRRYKAAGLVVFGKTAVPELAMDWTTRSRVHGITSNPWNTAYTAGTSSGGAAAAVAAGIVPMAHGNDAGGSIRVPASCCGCFGLKPTRGRNPHAPAGNLWQGMFVEHALTRSVRDSAALLDATAGSAPGQFYNSPAGGHFAAEVGEDPGILKIGYSTKAPYGAATHADCVQAVHAAVSLLDELGHICEPHDLPLPDDGWSSFETVWLSETAADMRLDETRLGRKLQPGDLPFAMLELVEAGRRISAADYCLAVTGLHRVCAAIGSVFERFDIVLTPTLAQPPLRHGDFPEHTDTGPVMRDYIDAYLSWMPYTHVFNVSGSPAMSAPLHWNDNGLPIGLQFAAAPAAEATLFRLAGQLEAATAWTNRHPGICISSSQS